MGTWGADNPRSRGKAGSSSGRANPSRSNAGSGGNPARGATRDATPAGRGRSSGAGSARASAELRHAVEGREHEYVGLGLIGVGVLTALAVYFGLAGIVGRGVSELIGWVVGLGRYAVPVALIAVGVALVRKGESASPVRLAVGWAMLGVALLGMLHIVRTPANWTDWDGMVDGGGLVGALIASPLQALIASAGAVVVLIAVFLGGTMLITSTSLKTMAANTGKGVGTVARPLGRVAKRAISDLSTLSSERGSERPARGRGELASPEPPLSGPARLYDGADDDPNVFTSAPAAKRKRTTKRDPSGQVALPLDGQQVGEWALPPLAFLKQVGAQAIDTAEIDARGRDLVETLASHGVDTELIDRTIGPTVTRYELELGEGVKVAKVTALNKDIAYAMAATDVRILAPIPGKKAIGIEVPNRKRQLVALGDLLASPEAVQATHPLEVAVGKDIAGKAVFLDLAATPHLLIAGATGAGKSSGINCILTSLLMRTTPDQVRLILIDPKQVEMGQYQRLPHLLTQPITNPKKAANALGWAVKEMERRYDILSAVGFRDVTGYNAAVARDEVPPPIGVAPDDTPYEHMPYIVVVVDELNDLMMVAARDVEESITRIAQKARAVGIHLIVATQRPSVNVITGVIKANIPARMAFAVTSLTDSRVILDQPGAEKLVGKGDMLLLPGNTSVPNRIQGSFVSEEEVRQVVAHWRQQAPEPVYSSNVPGDVTGDETGGASAPGAARQLSIDDRLGDDVTSDSNAFTAGDDDEDAVMMRQAMELVVRSQLGSTSMLQRKLKVGFARAGRIMDLLEQRGVVGPSEGSKAREVLMTVEEFELLQQNGSL